MRLVPAAESRSSRNGTDSSDLARMETAVPVDQRPATQLKELRDSQLYSWVCISGYATERFAFYHLILSMIWQACF